MKPQIQVGHVSWSPDYQSPKRVAARDSSPASCYDLIREILGAGYEIRMSPKNGIVTLTLQESQNGLIDVVEGELNPLQWGIERGLRENLKNAWDAMRGHNRKINEPGSVN